MFFTLINYPFNTNNTDRPDLINWSTNAKNTALAHIGDSKSKTWCQNIPATIFTPLSSTNSIIKFPVITSNNGFIISTTCNGNPPSSIILSSSVPTDNEWTKNGVLLSTSPSITITSGGTYGLRIRNTSCSVASLPISKVVQVVVCQGPPSNPTDKLFSFYPNPASANLTINYSLGSYEKFTIATLEIRDLIGRLIYTTKLANESNRFSFDLPNVANGAYNLNFRMNGKLVSSKLLSIQK